MRGVRGILARRGAGGSPTRLTHPFEPVWAPDARVLVLGSYPSVGSVENGGYCGHPSNGLWKILAEVFKTPWLARLYEPGEEERARLAFGSPREMVENTWAVRYTFLRMHEVALWDVIASCERDGNHEDGKIRAAEPNDVTGLMLRMPKLQAVLCNGAEACRRLHAWFPQFGPYSPVSETVVGDGPSVWRLPSTSAANRMPYAKKVAAWRWALHDEGVV